MFSIAALLTGIKLWVALKQNQPTTRNAFGPKDRPVTPKNFKLKDHNKN